MHREFLQKLTSLVEANLANESFGPEKLAKEIGMSHSNLNRKLKSIANQNSSQFIREVRLKKAKELLLNENATVSEISYRVGFGSPTYFNKCFHEYFGYAPGEMRNQEFPVNQNNGFYKKKIRRENKKKKKIRILFAAIIALLLTVTGIWVTNHRIHINRSVSRILPQAEKSFIEGNYLQAFNLTQKAGKYIPKYKDFQRLDSMVSAYQSIYSDPPGAKVFFKVYSDTTENGKFLGITPIDSIKVPIRMVFKYKLVKPDYDTIIAAELTDWNFTRKLFKTGKIPQGMEHVAILGNDSTGNYFIDKFEVTNSEYKEFISAGGYQNKKFWKYPFNKDRKTLTWEEAILLFIDKTGRPGPSTWQAGDYPPDEEDYPVSGISWYEAAAYAEFAGKELPTFTHWRNAKGLVTVESYLLTQSNFSGKGPAKVGYYNGMNAFGTYDMAGNVREWCFNGNSEFRTICGGAWNDNFYSYRDVIVAKAFDRSEKNGVRCVKYIERAKIPLSCFDTTNIEFSQTEPAVPNTVRDDVFQVVKNQFLYFKSPLDARIERVDHSNKNYTCEKITFNTVYDDKRMIVYLCIPKISDPPYQTVIIFPGIDWFMAGPSDILINNQVSALDFFLKDGRALMFPVYYGVLERAKDIENLTLTPEQHPKHYIIDFSRSVDYLETREDINIEKLAVLGASWGGIWASMVPAIDERVKVTVIYISGLAFFNQDLPEWNQNNFVARVKIPTLMLNGKYDLYFDLNSSTMPMFKLLETPLKDKRIIVYETDHFVPYKDLVFESLNWLDEYLGPVTKKRGSNLNKD
jgi:AraC-like DNA-binding protein/dienelactone hydrolase